MPSNIDTKIQYSLADPFLADELFCNLTEEARRSLSEITHRMDFKKGVTIFSPGDMPAGLSVLINGDAHVFLTDEGSRFFRLANVTEVFGLTETIVGQPYQMTLKAIIPCSFEFIKKKDFIHFLQSESSFCFHLVKLLGLNLLKSHKIIYSSII